LDETCSHLLAHDFVDNHFTLILRSTITTSQNENFVSKILVVQTESDHVELELGNPFGSIKNGNNLTSALPVITSEGLLITRELNVVTITSKRGFKVECNLEFDMCLIKISGW
jgi:hypothetical protein